MSGVGRVETRMSFLRGQRVNQVTLNWWFQSVVWGIESLFLVEGRWETTPVTTKPPIQTKHQSEGSCKFPLVHFAWMLGLQLFAN